MHDIKILPEFVTIHIANGDTLKTNKMGILKAKFQGKTLNIEALIVPNMKHNLMSASKLTSRGYKIVVDQNKTTIEGNKFNLVCEYKNGLYMLNLDSLDMKTNESCNTIIEDLWHRRLGHIGKESLTQLGFEKSEKICTTCIEGKATRIKFNESERKTKTMGELIHSDVCGPISPNTQDGSTYTSKQ